MKKKGNKQRNRGNRQTKDKQTDTDLNRHKTNRRQETTIDTHTLFLKRGQLRQP